MHLPPVHVTAAGLQQSATVVQLSLTPWQLTLLTSTHVPMSQNPEQHSKPAPHVPPAVGPDAEAVHCASAQNPRMLVVSSS